MIAAEFRAWRLLLAPAPVPHQGGPGARRIAVPAKIHDDKQHSSSRTSMDIAGPAVNNFSVKRPLIMSRAVSTSRPRWAPTLA